MRVCTKKRDSRTRKKRKDGSESEEKKSACRGGGVSFCRDASACRDGGVTFRNWPLQQAPSAVVGVKPQSRRSSATYVGKATNSPVHVWQCHKAGQPWSGRLKKARLQTTAPTTPEKCPTPHKTRQVGHTLRQTLLVVERCGVCITNECRMNVLNICAWCTKNAL